jgi:hypothetical protein
MDNISFFGNTSPPFLSFLSPISFFTFFFFVSFLPRFVSFFRFSLNFSFVSLSLCFSFIWGESTSFFRLKKMKERLQEERNEITFFFHYFFYVLPSFPQKQGWKQIHFSFCLSTFAWPERVRPKEVLSHISTCEYELLFQYNCTF